MFLQTIKSKDGKLVAHGNVTWKNGDEFGFLPQGNRASNEWWCKFDFWELIESQLTVFNLVVQGTGEEAA
ncbi:MAG: hypothetical protein N2645_04630 [Clostridia bacterium]|nr:hypothetical protein [Clostridia bacterium]